LEVDAHDALTNSAGYVGRKLPTVYYCDYIVNEHPLRLEPIHLNDRPLQVTIDVFDTINVNFSFSRSALMVLAHTIQYCIQLQAYSIDDILDGDHLTKGPPRQSRNPFPHLT
jgi:hypothetical protein